MTPNLRRHLCNAAVFTALVAADQIVKCLVRAPDDFTARALIPGVLGLRRTFNSGAAFGLLSDTGPLLTIVSAVAVVGIAMYARRFLVGFWLPRTAFLLILSGAAGNLIDRAVFGSVTDMFEFLFVRFAIFNVADALLTCGCVLMAAYFLFFHEDTTRMSRDV
jgi:signal peptidase II